MVAEETTMEVEAEEVVEEVGVAVATFVFNGEWQDTGLEMAEGDLL